ncbi:MAG TPA: threonine--tRNA ligase [Clostridiales bacterium]|nr:threonine--tRNA ligase [Clostridiales bacterium]
MKITYKDKVYNYDDGVMFIDIAKDLALEDFKKILAVKVDEKLIGLYTLVEGDSTIDFVTFESPEGKDIYRHSSAHIMAQAVKRLYPDVKVAIGPSIENGFYYDFDFTSPISKDDLEKIEKEMTKIIKANYPIIRQEITKKEAFEMFQNHNEIYKIDLIEHLPEEETISIYKQEDFIDLCRGPHVPSTRYIKAFKLLSVTGAYWRGDEKNKMLTRIYGTSFDTKEALAAHLEALEEAKQNDHNKIGRELRYFMTDENIGQGLPLLMPKGAKLFQILTRFIEDTEAKEGYELTKTPYLAKSKLYKISKHWDHYRDGMFIIDNEDENEVMALRPMTCPFQYTIYNNGLKSYRDLPVKYAETSTLFRNESSGEMHGLIRVRQFTISEAHIMCMPSQLEEEFKKVLNLIHYVLKAVGLDDDISYRFSRWDPSETGKYINAPEKWEKAEKEMEKILKDLNIEYTTGIGEAAFYGPKLDIQIKNVYGKEDTLVTVQVDMFLAENFDMTYIDESGQKQRPYIIHRTSIGCYERTMALLLEKYKGALPLWLSPEQVRVISLTDRTIDNTIEIEKILRNANIRVTSDTRNEKVGYKIREAQLEKVPYMLVIGDKEVENGVVAVRKRSKGDIGTMTLDEFINMLKEEIENKVLS